MAKKTSQSTPLKIELSSRTYSIYDFFGCNENLTSLKERFDKILEDAWQEWPEHNLTAANITFDEDTEYGCYGDRDRDVIVVRVHRYETPEEVKARLAKAKERKRKAKLTAEKTKARKELEQQEEERIEYARLKRKFEGNSFD